MSATDLIYPNISYKKISGIAFNGSIEQSGLTVWDYNVSCYVYRNVALNIIVMVGYTVPTSASANIAIPNKYQLGISGTDLPLFRSVWELDMNTCYTDFKVYLCGDNGIVGFLVYDCTYTSNANTESRTSTKTIMNLSWNNLTYFPRSSTGAGRLFIKIEFTKTKYR